MHDSGRLPERTVEGRGPVALTRGGKLVTLWALLVVELVLVSWLWLHGPRPALWFYRDPAGDGAAVFVRNACGSYDRWVVFRRGIHFPNSVVFRGPAERAGCR